MSFWHLQNPGNFRMEFHEAMRQGLGTHCVRKLLTEKDAIKEQKRWRLFMYCLRHYTYPGTTEFLPLFKRRTFIEREPMGRTWDLMIKVTAPDKDITDGMQILAKSVDRDHGLM